MKNYTKLNRIYCNLENPKLMQLYGNQFYIKSGQSCLKSFDSNLRQINFLQRKYCKQQKLRTKSLFIALIKIISKHAQISLSCRKYLKKKENDDEIRNRPYFKKHFLKIYCCWFYTKSSFYLKDNHAICVPNDKEMIYFDIMNFDLTQIIWWIFITVLKFCTTL